MTCSRCRQRPVAPGRYSKLCLDCRYRRKFKRRKYAWTPEAEAVLREPRPSASRRGRSSAALPSSVSRGRQIVGNGAPRRLPSWSSALEHAQAYDLAKVDHLWLVDVMRAAIARHRQPCSVCEREIVGEPIVEERPSGAGEIERHLLCVDCAERLGSR